MMSETFVRPPERDMQKFILGLTLLLAACAPGIKPNVDVPRMVDKPKPGKEFAAKANDFTCILRTAEKGNPPDTSWHHVRNFYLKNTMGRTQEALDVANGLKPGPYPVGTMLQLIYMEGMVKRGGDFSPGSNGWEFFSLGIADDNKTTVIRKRGSFDVVNFAGGNCLGCHGKAKPEFDFVCEQEHGCDPLPASHTAISLMQSGDPRCR
jgi:hypothetical protein